MKIKYFALILISVLVGYFISDIAFQNKEAIWLDQVTVYEKTIKESQEKNDDLLVTIADQEKELSKMSSSILSLEDQKIKRDQRIEQLEKITANYKDRQDAFYNFKSFTEKLILEQNEWILREYDFENALKVHVVDIDSYETNVHFYLERSDSRLKDAERLADVLSNYCFSGLEIEIMPSDDILNINILEISDKNDQGYYNEPSWINGYFNGSAGGIYTEKTLMETMLQVDIDDWYEGVRFYYEGETNTMYGHVERLFYDVIYREQ